MGKRGPTSLETKQKQLNMFLLEVAFLGVTMDSVEQETDFYESFPGTQIRRNYGTDCYKLFLLCFIEYNRGGIDSKGCAYKTRWKFNRATKKHLYFLTKQKKKGHPDFQTAKQWGHYLEKNGIQRLRNTVITDERGTRMGRQIMTMEDSKKQMKVNREMSRLAAEIQSSAVSPIEIAADYIDIASTYTGATHD